MQCIPMAIAVTTATATIQIEIANAIMSAGFPRIFNNTTQFVTDIKTIKNVPITSYLEHEFVSVDFEW